MVSRVDIHNAFTDPELIRHFYDILGARDGIGANGGQDQVFYDSQVGLEPPAKKKKQKM